MGSATYVLLRLGDLPCPSVFSRIAYHKEIKTLHGRLLDDATERRNESFGFFPFTSLQISGKADKGTVDLRSRRGTTIPPELLQGNVF